MLIALRKAKFTEITPSPVTTMVPPHGARSPCPVWLICVNISIIRGYCHRTPGTTADS